MKFEYNKEYEQLKPKYHSLEYELKNGILIISLNKEKPVNTFT